MILAGAELFTNGVEWIGEGFGLSEGAVGSVLAAVGTALPETLLPLVAILSGHDAGEEIGTGAILGAPFMLTTLAMVVIAVAVLLSARGGRRRTDLEFDRRRDPAGPRLLPRDVRAGGRRRAARTRRRCDYALVIVLVVGYVYYVRRHFQAPGEASWRRRRATEIKPLYVWAWLWRRSGDRCRRGRRTRRSRAPFVQVGAGARADRRRGASCSSGRSTTSATSFDVSPLAFSLLVAPIATELPEKFNSVIWVRRRKDTLALGNMTGAMVFQSSFPVTIGLLLTPWELDGDRRSWPR